METAGKVYSLNEGRHVELGCKFASYNFDLFNNPIQWRKTQRIDSVEINYMSNVKAPLLSTRRFSVSFLKDEPNYDMRLTIISKYALVRILYTVFLVQFVLQYCTRCFHDTSGSLYCAFSCIDMICLLKAS